MALPPTIPTSFVPHPAGAAPRQYRSDLTGAFGFFAYGVLVLVFILALGVFLYGRVLAGEQISKDAALAKAEAGIDPTTVESFVHLRNRLNLGESLLDKHVAFSNFFTSLQTLLPANVRFTALHLFTDPSGASKIDGSGVAKSFNALAALSAAFAADGRVKDAIFSKIIINRDASVSFGLSATLDPRLVLFTPGVSAPSAPAVATSTAPLP